MPILSSGAKYTPLHPEAGLITFFSSSLVCKFKAHKRCAVRATNNCKWTTLASIGKDIIEDEDGVGVSLNFSSLTLIWKYCLVFYSFFSLHK